MLRLELRSGLVDVCLPSLVDALVLCLRSEGIIFEALITHFKILYLTPDFCCGTVLSVLSHCLSASGHDDFLDSPLISSLTEDDEFSTAGLECDLGKPISRISAYLPGPLSISWI